MRKFDTIKILGKTKEDQIVLKGYDICDFNNTYGLPLEYILQYLKYNNCIVEWVTFIIKANELGWNINKTLSKIEYALKDVYDEIYADTIIKRLYKKFEFKF